MSRPPGTVFDGHEDAILDRVAANESVASIAASFDRASQNLYRWLVRPERVERYREAARLSTHALEDQVDEAIAILDKLSGEDLTSAAVSRAKLKIDQLRYRQRIRNPDDYGEKQGPLVSVSLGDLHLTALQQGGRIEIANPTPKALIGSPDDAEDTDA